MKRLRILAAATIAITGFASCSSAAAATINFDISQVGSDVVATASGSFDDTGLTPSGQAIGNDGIVGPSGYLGVGTGSQHITIYRGLTTGVAFGTNNSLEFASFGDPSTRIILFSQYGFFDIDSSYQIGTPFSTSGTYTGQTLASLGLTAGVYNLAIGDNSIVVSIGQAAAVPEPATWAMMLLGFGGIGFAMRRRSETRLKQLA